MKQCMDAANLHRILCGRRNRIYYADRCVIGGIDSCQGKSGN